MSNVIKLNGYDVRDPAAVHYNAADGMTDAQKAQARENIGAASIANVAETNNAINNVSDVVFSQDYGSGIIPANPAYTQYINPATYGFSAEYNHKNIFTCKAVSNSSGARTVGFNAGNSTGYTPVNMAGKLARVTLDLSGASDNNLQVVVVGVSNDGSATKTWSLTFKTIPSGVFVFDSDRLQTATGYTRLFVSGFYFDSQSVRTAGEIYKFTVEIADADDVADGWDVNERVDTLNEKVDALAEDVEETAPPVIYGFSDIHIKGINHRGYNSIAPENTLPAFRLSRQKGFDFVETDIMKTSDGVYVLLHDVSINRTARNADGTAIGETINIADITYAQALTYDFGIYKNSQYAGTKIPTFEEFIVLCARLGLFPYIELKVDANFDQTDINNLVAIVKKYHMERRVSWISFSWNVQHMVFLADDGARIGWLGTGMGTDVPETALETLSNGRNEIFMDANVSGLTPEFINACQTLGVPLEVYAPNTESGMTSLDDYITGATSDLLNFAEVIYNANIGDDNTGIIS